MDASIRYYIRGGGKTFGPVDRATLVDWARDSRIEPSFAVSRDGKDWMPAPRLAELEMDWLVETDPGTFYGPFNRKVVETLLADGTLPKTARLYRLDAGGDAAGAKKRDSDPALTRLTEENGRLAADLAAKKKALADIETRAAQQAETTQKTIAFMEAKLAELTVAQSSAGQAAQAERAAARAELAAAQEEIYRGRERVERAEARAAEAEGRVKDAETAAVRASAEKEALEKRFAVAETELADLRAQLEAVTKFTRPAPPPPSGPQPVQPEIVVAEVPPKTPPRFGGKGGGAGLAALEAAAARELAAAKKHGIDLAGLFGGRK